MLKNAETNKEEMLERVADSIVTNRLVLFIGAGFATSIGFPSWKDLLTELNKNEAEGRIKTIESNTIEETKEEEKKQIDQIRQRIQILIEYGYYSDAAEEIYNLYGIKATGEFQRYIAHQFCFKNERELDYLINEKRNYHLLSELYKCGAKKIVTTNYDQSIDRCINGINPELKPLFVSKEKTINNIKQAIIESDSYYIKIHGDAKNTYEKGNEYPLVLRKKEYRESYSLHDELPELLQELFTHNRILFIGCSLTDQYMDIFEKLYEKKAVMQSYVVCLEDEHIELEGKTGIKPIRLKDYSELDDLLEKMLIITKKKQQEHCNKVLFEALPLKDYDYISARKFFRCVSEKNSSACYFFNTQVEFSSWFSPVLQLHLSQQGNAYFKHREDNSFKHYRILFLPFGNITFNDYLQNDELFRHDIKAMEIIHQCMSCQLVFITIDSFLEIINNDKSGFFLNEETLKCLGLIGLATEGFSFQTLSRLISKQTNGYTEKRDLDFSVITSNTGHHQIWQANYKQIHNKNKGKFKYTQITDDKSFQVYSEFFGIIIKEIENDFLKYTNPVFIDDDDNEYNLLDYIQK